MKPTKRKIREFIKDESMGIRDYRKYGFPGLARDEARHKAFLKMMLRRMK